MYYINGTPVGGVANVIEESDYVEVVADGVKTYSALMDELYAALDRQRVNHNALFELQDDSNMFTYANFFQLGADFVVFTTSFAYTTTADSTIRSYVVRQSGSNYWFARLNGTVGSRDSTVFPNGFRIRIYYNDAHTFDFNTKAENCIYGNSNVKDALDALQYYYEDINIQLSALSWSSSAAGKYYATVVPSNGDEILAITIKGWDTYRASDNVQPYINGSGGVSFMSPTNSFADANTSKIGIRILYQKS